MTAQLSGGVVADSLLYSFTPAAVVRGGSPMASPAAAPPPLSSARRHRAQSVPGEPTHRGVELDDLHMELHVGGSSRASATANLPSSSTTHNMASLTSGSVAMAPKPPAIGFSRCGSADRHQHHHGPSSSLASLASLASLTTFAAAGGGGGPGGSGPMPLISGGERGLPPMRHSISGNSGIGLPKLDLPAIVFGGGGGGPSDVPGSGRRSLSGGFCDTAAAAAFLDMPLSPAAAVFDGSAPPSPSRSSAPAVLAPLRVCGAFASACGGGGGGAEAAAGGGGWCGSGGGSFTAVGSRRYTPSAGVPTAEMGGLPFSPGPLLPCASESAVTTPLTPNVPAVSNPVAPPRRSHSLSSRSPASTQRMLGDGGAAADDAAGGLGGSAAVAISPDAPSVADRERGGGSSNTAAKAMYDINNDLQRAAGALLALHAPMCRPRSPPTPAAAAAAITLAGASAAPSPPPPSPPPPSVLTASQLAALKESAPELQWELRVAVRRIFQVLRQELSAAPGGRQLGSAVHECWATLDAYLECTTELTCLLVEGALEAREVREPPPTSSAVAAPASTSTSGQRQPVGGDGGDCVQEAQREAERLRTDNVELRRQLEECRARLARAEAAAAAEVDAQAAAATAAGAAAGGARGAAGPGSGSGSGFGSSPRPPLTAAAPPLERCCSTSPRRGKHALVQSSRDDAASAPDGAAAAASSPSAPASSSAAAAAAAMSGSGRGGDAGGGGGPRRFDRAAVLARGPSYGDEMVIEDKDSEDSDVEADSIDARRHVLTYHSASFAEWVRGARRR